MGRDKKKKAVYDRDYSKRYRENNKELLAAKQRAYYAANKEKRQAYNKAYHDAHKEERREYEQKWLARTRKQRLEIYHANKEIEKARMKAYRDARKVRVFNAYGGCHCKCCGETEMEFLSIDHVNSGGTQHRKEVSKGGGAFYNWLINNNFPPGYQVLCMNCNFSKGNGGQCVHRRQANEEYEPFTFVA